MVQTELKLPMVGAFDLYAAETSFLAGLDIATRYITAGARGVLLIAAESDNQLVDLPGQAGSVHAPAPLAAGVGPAGGESGGPSPPARAGGPPRVSCTLAALIRLLH